MLSGETSYVEKGGSWKKVECFFPACLGLLPCIDQGEFLSQHPWYVLLGWYLDLVMVFPEQLTHPGWGVAVNNSHPLTDVLEHLTFGRALFNILI